MSSLYKTRGFLAFSFMIFLNAFVDLGHKIIIQNTIFKVYDGSTQVILTAIVNGLILLPFVFLFTPSGFLADRFKKPSIMKWAAFSAVIITLLITASYYLGWFKFAFAMTFLLAVQSAFYSPSKYGYIIEIAGKNKLSFANGVVQSVTIVAILLGMFVFSILFEGRLSEQSFHTEAEVITAIAPLGWLLVIGSLIELFFAFRIPSHNAVQEKSAFNWFSYATGKTLNKNTRLLRADSLIWFSIVGLSIFWGLSQVVLATFPAFAKETLAITNTVVIQGLLACSGIGIVIGSLLAGKISHSFIEKALIPFGAVGIAVTLFLLPHLSSTLLLSLDILAFGFFGGLFIVPLNSLIQFQAKAHELGTILAGNNWVQNSVMLSFLILTVALSFMNINSELILNLLAILALFAAIYSIWKLPKELTRYALKLLFSGRYRITMLGLENIPNRGGVLLLGNHISWLDWAIIYIASPRPVRFVMDKTIYQRLHLSWFLDFFGVIPISGNTSKEALNTINHHLKQGEVVCLFPEGAISRNGQLAEFKKGFEHCTSDVDGVIIPFYLHGLWGSHFSRSDHYRSPNALRRPLTVAFGQPLDMDSSAYQVKSAVASLSIATWKKEMASSPSLAQAWIHRVKQNPSADCVTDLQSKITLSRRKTLTAALLFSRRIKKDSPEKNIGLLIPTSSAGLITNMAAFISGKTVINLNFTAHIEALISAIKKAEISTIYTSRRFLTNLEKKGVQLDALFSVATPIYLEDIHQELTPLKKISTLLLTYLPAAILIRLFVTQADKDQAAAILFSSGSEGEPKGIMLSQQNILGNIKQVAHVLDTQQKDILVANLPLFHAFGLTITGLLPLIEGIPALCHPDPTDVVNIAKGIHRYKATVLCATSTFLRLFNKNRRIHPLMMDSLRAVVSGAERLSPEVREQFTLKFGKMIYEGYGATETAPVATVNIPDQIDSNEFSIQVGNKLNTVGLALPGSNIRIIDPVSLDTLPPGEDGLILIAGLQIMSGYLKDEQKTQESLILLDGHYWYKTGDKGHLDQDGFLVIVDRYSRFAKIGGEMISLGAVEASINQQLPEEVEVLATSIPDDKKGEKVALLFTDNITQETLKTCIRNSDLNPLMTPQLLLPVSVIPKLGSGKSDFNAAKQFVLSNIGL